jgi:hypothetical protein
LREVSPLALKRVGGGDGRQARALLVNRLRDRNFAAVRVFRPSKRFTDADLIPGGGAASAAAETENVAAVNRILDRLKDDPHLLGGADQDPTHVAAMERAKALVPQLATTGAKKEFVRLLRSILDPSMKENDDASAGFFAVDAETLFENTQTAVVAPAAPGGGAGGGSSLGNGGAAGLGDLLSGVQAAARRIANFATYYQMKSRAGLVGSTGLADLLRRVRDAKAAIRIHLVGHSFGGRLVTAAAHALSVNTDLVTMSLLQSAFSHNGLSEGFGEAPKEQGFFRAIVDEKRISGPIIITHTKNDKAVGIAYPLASRIAGQNAAALGDQNDPYGGMGRNGAQNTKEADNQFTSGLPGTRYSFQKGGRWAGFQATRGRAFLSSVPTKPKPQPEEHPVGGFGTQGAVPAEGPSTNTIIHFWQAHVRAVVSLRPRQAELRAFATSSVETRDVNSIGSLSRRSAKGLSFGTTRLGAVFAGSGMGLDLLTAGKTCSVI